MDEEGVFAVKVEFQPGSPDPAHVFRAMSSLLDSLAVLDQDLAAALGAKARPVLLLERVEAGSLKAWLRTAVESVDDEALQDLNVKRGVGTYLVRAKRWLLNRIKDKPAIQSREEVRELSRGLQELASGVEIGTLPAPEPVPVDKLMNHISNISHSLTNLQPGDGASYDSDEGEVPFNPGLKLTSQEVEALLTKESISNESMMILKVKKPDFLGSSQWEFRHQRHTLEARIADTDWLARFHARAETVLPGDALRAMVRTDVSYGYDGDVVAAHYTVTRILEVIKYDAQAQLPLLPPGPDGAA